MEKVPSDTTFITVYLIISRIRSYMLGSLPLSPSSTHWHNQSMCTIGSASPRSTARQSLPSLSSPSLTKPLPYPPQTLVVSRPLLMSREKPPPPPSCHIHKIMLSLTPDLCSHIHQLQSTFVPLAVRTLQTSFYILLHYVPCTFDASVLDPLLSFHCSCV